MNYRQFIKKIQNGQLSPFYFIFGEDDFLFTEGLKILQKAYLSEDGSIEVFDEGVSLKTVLSQARGGDIFSPQKILVLKSPVFLKNKSTDDEEELVTNYLKKPAADVLIIIFTLFVDKRRKFFKKMVKEKLAYDFNPLKGRELSIWARELARTLKEEISTSASETLPRNSEEPSPLAPALLDYLLMCSGGDMAQIAMDLEKIFLYMGDDHDLGQDSLRRLVSCTHDAGIFALVDTLGQEKRGEGLALVKEMVYQGEPPLRILFMISRQLQLLFKVKRLLQEGVETRELPRKLSLPPFVTGKLSRQADHFSPSDITKALQLARQADYAIKTGQKTPEMALTLLLLHL